MFGSGRGLKLVFKMFTQSLARNLNNNREATRDKRGRGGLGDQCAMRGGGEKKNPLCCPPADLKQTIRRATVTITLLNFSENDRLSKRSPLCEHMFT